MPYQWCCRSGSWCTGARGLRSLKAPTAIEKLCDFLLASLQKCNQTQPLLYSSKYAVWKACCSSCLGDFTAELPTFLPCSTPSNEDPAQRRALKRLLSPAPKPQATDNLLKLDEASLALLVFLVSIQSLYLWKPNIVRNSRLNCSILFWQG